MQFDEAARMQKVDEERKLNVATAAAFVLIQFLLIFLMSLSTICCHKKH